MIILDLDKNELKSMPKDKIVDKYITNVTIVNDDPEFQEYMSKEEDERKIKNSLLTEAREEGINIGKKQGFDEGINTGKEEVAVNLLKTNMDIKEISKVTGLSISCINELKKNI